MSCPDWSNLVELRDRDGEGELLWDRALGHLDGCERCREHAYAVEPTLIFRRLPALEPTRQEVESMKQAVGALRRAQPIVEPAARDRRRTLGRVWPGTRLMRAAAMVAVVAGTALLYGVMTPGISSGPGDLRDASAQGLMGAFFSADEGDLRFEIRVLRASKHELGGPSLAESDPPPELIAELDKMIRDRNYQVLAQAGVTSTQGEANSSALGDGFEVSFKTGSVEGRQVLVEDFTIERKGGKSARAKVPLLLRTPLHLELDQPFTVIVGQSNQDDLLVVAVTWKSGTAASTETAP